MFIKVLGRGAAELGVVIVTSFAGTATLCVLTVLLALRVNMVSVVSGGLVMTKWTGPACDKTEIPGTEEGKVGAGVETE